MIMSKVWNIRLHGSCNADCDHEIHDYAETERSEDEASRMYELYKHMFTINYKIGQLMTLPISDERKETLLTMLWRQNLQIQDTLNSFITVFTPVK